ncbi:MAG: hypothetical protein K0U84_01605 [Actinomycetia bacterium]|nr:hypothetical protein [Actinomycetes bacterium]
MTDTWEQIFAEVGKVPGSTAQQPAKKTVQALQEESEYARKRYAADVAVSMGAVDTGADFDPFAALADIAEGNSDAIDDLDDRIASLEGDVGTGIPGDITALDVRVTALEAAVTALDARVTALEP